MLLVIIGHAFPDAEKEFYLVGGRDSFASFIENLIYSFHMPLFMLCSGFLFLPKLTKEINIRVEISKRFQRLMIPYFFYSIIVYILKIFLINMQITLSKYKIFGKFSFVKVQVGECGFYGHYS